MIDVSWTDEAVFVEVKVPYPASHTFTLEIKTSSRWSNRLLGYTVREALLRKLESIREDAYLQGWKDAKAKRAKRRTFFRGWET